MSARFAAVPCSENTCAAASRIAAAVRSNRGAVFKSDVTGIADPSLDVLISGRNISVLTSLIGDDTCVSHQAVDTSRALWRPARAREDGNDQGVFMPAQTMTSDRAAPVVGSDG